MNRRLLAAATLLLAGCRPPHEAQRSARADSLRAVLHRFHAESRFPGAVIGAWFADDSSTIVESVGLADRDTKTPMPRDARLHAGSVGKTLYAALALQLIGEGRFGLDDKVTTYLGREPWYARVPNARDITVRMLLNHTSGVPEYGYDFMVDLIKDPGRARTPLDAVKSVLDAKPAAAAGERFTYSDVNYQLLELLMEQVTGAPASREIQRRIVQPLRLASFLPAESRVIPGLVAGYAGHDNFMKFDAVMQGDSLVMHPAFEGGGGGFVTNAGDLARWIAAFSEGVPFPSSLLAPAHRGVPAGQLDVGGNAQSALGLEIAPSALGPAYGHGGFFPGYLTLALWYPERGVAIAIQVNSSAQDALSTPLRDVLLEAARAVGRPTS